MLVNDQFRIKRINQVGLGGIATCDGLVEADENGAGSVIHLNFSVGFVQIISIFLFTAFIAWQRKDALADPVTRMSSILIVLVAFIFFTVGSLVRFNMEVQRSCAVMQAT